LINPPEPEERYRIWLKMMGKITGQCFFRANPGDRQTSLGKTNPFIAKTPKKFAAKLGKVIGQFLGIFSGR